MIDPTQEELYCVYKITNTVNGMVYIGITNCLQFRWYHHRTASLKGRGPLYQDMRTFGRDKFTVETVEEGIRSSQANKREAYWIDAANSAFPHGYNMDAGSLKRQYKKALDDDTAPRPVVRKEQEG